MQSVLVVHNMFQVFAIGYGNAETLSNVHLAWLSIPIMTGIGMHMPPFPINAQIETKGSQLHSPNKLRVSNLYVFGFEICWNYHNYGNSIKLDQYVSLMTLQVALAQAISACIGGVQILNIGDLRRLQRRAYVSTAVSPLTIP